MTNKTEPKVKHDQHSFLFVHQRMLQLLGLWIHQNASFSYRGYSIFLMICLSIVTIQQLVQMTTHYDLESLSKTIDITTLTISTIFRQIFFFLYSTHFSNLKVKIDKDFTSDRLPGSREYYMEKEIKRNKLFTYFYWSLPIVSNIILRLTNLSVYLNILDFIPTFNLKGNDDILNFEMNKNTTMNDKELMDSNSNFNNHLYLNCWYPFDTETSPGSEIAYVWECMILITTGTIYFSIDAFIFTMIWLICKQLEILKISLDMLSENGQNNITNDGGFVLLSNYKGNLKVIL